MPEPTAPEPTMDEILASIRRIITDDDAPEGDAKASEPAAASAPAAKAKAEDAPSVSEVETSGGQAGKAESGKKSSDDTATASEKNMAETKGGEAQVDPDSLVGDKAATDTASAFAKLTVAVKESAGEPSMTMPAPGRSLEDVVRELLRPILKEWLETHLPEIVREHVEEEVARISRGSRPR
jgi:cell pole-organizing protein PopZ